MVQIGDCGALRGQGASGALCGKVVWIRDAVDKATGRPPVDIRNADPALRARPIMGLTVLSDLKPAGTPGRWDGRVYNIDDDKTYNARVTLVGAAQLKVEGCVMMICQGRDLDPSGPARALTNHPRMIRRSGHRFADKIMRKAILRAG
jgi:uncharacterized protein (DUF2147 family)